MKGQSAHIILARDDAKLVFAQKDDAAIRKVVTELRQSPRLKELKFVLECGPSWELIQRCFSDGTLDPAGGEFPLNHCILGGRRLHQGTDFEAVLKRPDIVPMVAQELHSLKRTEFVDMLTKIDPQVSGQQPTESEVHYAWTELSQIRQLFEDAAAEHMAVLFTVET